MWDKMRTYEMVNERLKIQSYSTKTTGNKDYIRNLNRIRQIIRYAIGESSGEIEQMVINVPKHTVSGIARRLSRSEDTIRAYISSICLDTLIGYKIGNETFNPPKVGNVIKRQPTMPSEEIFRNSSSIDGTTPYYVLTFRRSRQRGGAQ